MELPLDMSVRSIAYLFTLYCVVVMLMPARYLFAVTGLVLIGVGVFVVGYSWIQGLLVLAFGVGLVALAIRTVRAERRREAEQAQQAVESASRISRGRHPSK